MNKKTNTNKKVNNMGLMDKNYEEISFTCTESNLPYESSYANSSLNFFGVRSGLTYTNLDINTLESR